MHIATSVIIVKLEAIYKVNIETNT